MTTGLWVRNMSGPNNGTSKHEFQTQSPTTSAQASIATVAGDDWYQFDMTVADYKAGIAWNLLGSASEKPTSCVIAFDLRLSTIINNAAPVEAPICSIVRASDGLIYGRLALIAGATNTTRKLKLFGLSGSGSSITTSDLAIDTNYRIEAFWRGVGDLRMSLRLNGAVVEASPTYNYLGSIPQPLNSYFLGGNLSGAMGGKAGNDSDVVANIKDFAVSIRDDGAGNWIGTAATVDCIRPNADTAVEQWTRSTGADSYALVDETTPDTADYLTVSNSSADDNKATELDMQSAATGGVTAPLAVLMRAHLFPGVTAAASPVDVEIGVDDNGTNSTVGIGSTMIADGVGSMYPQTSAALKPFDTRPSNGADWATADIDALKFRILRNTTYDGTNRRAMTLATAKIDVLDGAVGSALPADTGSRARSWGMVMEIVLMLMLLEAVRGGADLFG